MKVVPRCKNNNINNKILKTLNPCRFKMCLILQTQGTRLYYWDLSFLFMGLFQRGERKPVKVLQSSLCGSRPCPETRRLSESSQPEAAGKRPPDPLASLRPGWSSTERTDFSAWFILGWWIKVLPEQFSCRVHNLYHIKWMIYCWGTVGCKGNNFSLGCA